MLKRKFIGIVMVLLLVGIGCFAGTASAQGTTASGEYSDGGRWQIDEEGTLSLEGGTVGNYHSVKAPWYGERASVVKVVFQDVKASGSLYGLFSEYENLQAVDFTGFNTDKATDMGALFAHCSKLTEVNFNGFNTANVQNFEYMFADCASLRNLDLTSFDTSQALYMNSMFFNCVDLAAVDLSSFTTEKVKLMSYMFTNCQALTELDLSNFVTSNVIRMDVLFGNCVSLEKLDISQFDTSNTASESLAHLLAACYKLSRLILGPNLDCKGYTIDLAENTDPVYTGKWYGINNGVIFDSSSEMIKNFNGTADEYCKQRATPNQITFDLNGGSGAIGAVSKLDGERLEEPAVPTRAGYTFLGWYVNGTSYDFSKIVSSSFSLTAQWEKKATPVSSCQVVFDAGGGSQVATQQLVVGSQAVRPNDPSRSGYRFIGWYLDAAGTQAYDFDTLVTKDVTLYARWEIAEEGLPHGMYRLYNPNSGEHFYTAALKERANLIAAGWQAEGVAWTAPENGDPVYRLYNPNAGDHHYTLSKEEHDWLVTVGWLSEGIGWYSSTTKEVAVYRTYNPNALSGSHHYTTALSEKDGLVALGWRDEATGWYGVN